MQGTGRLFRFLGVFDSGDRHCPFSIYRFLAGGWHLYTGCIIDEIGSDKACRLPAKLQGRQAVSLHENGHCRAIETQMETPGRTDSQNGRQGNIPKI
jgi:hypothetical protein